MNFVIDHDRRDVFRFAPSQSDFAKKELEKFKMDNLKLESVILIEDEKMYSKSTAALMIAKELSGPIKILFPLMVFPKFLRDFIYDLVARYRYKIFGKREICRIPTEEEKSKFLN